MTSHSADQDAYDELASYTLSHGVAALATAHGLDAWAADGGSVG